ncbi:MAG: GNAT family N-acetyltransferase, partial [Mangrovicoccus sp.]
MHTELRQGWDAAQSLAASWRELSLSGQGSSLFNSFDFLDVWQQHFGSDVDLVILTVYDGEQLVGLAPLQIDTIRRGSVSLRRLGFVKNPHISRGGALARGDIDAVTAAMAQNLAENAALFDDLVFDCMVWNCPVQESLRAAIEAAGFLTNWEVMERPLQYIQFDGDEDAFVESRPKRVRQDFRRAIRRCHELDGFALTSSQPKTSPRETVQRLFSIDWLAAKRVRPGALYPPEAKLFYVGLAERFGESSAIELTEARCGDRLMANIITVTYAGVRYLMVTHSDYEFSKQNVGRYVVLRSISNGLTDPDCRLVDTNGDSLFLSQISTDS